MRREGVTSRLRDISSGRVGLRPRRLRFVGTDEAHPIGRRVRKVVWRCIVQGVRFESKGATDAANSTVASGKHIDVRVADHNGFGRRDGVAGLPGGFGDESFETVGIGFLGVKAVPAVVLKEEARETEVGTDVAGGVYGLVGEDCHEGVRYGGAN